MSRAARGGLVPVLTARNPKWRELLPSDTELTEVDKTLKLGLLYSGLQAEEAHKGLHHLCTERRPARSEEFTLRRIKAAWRAGFLMKGAGASSGRPPLGHVLQKGAVKTR